ncbi:MAG: HDOD domain-containing protein [Deltaproteobacteria bacterium]|jgi:putative nucleotidyltransferase with HDIG domain
MEKNIIPSGNYAIDEAGPHIMEAHLGSCAGITLCDVQNGLGGLIHILLPEPTGTNVPFHKATYASTGVPSFVEALCAAGASVETLRACIAGGALIGPVSEQDLSLDIGGRTAEIAQDILQKDHIPLVMSEVGGYFGCTLRLDLSTLETEITPLCAEEEAPDIDMPAPTLKEIEDRIEYIQPIPQVALKILRMLHEDTCSLKHIGHQVQQDQVIASRVINLCNSALFGLRYTVDSIDRALILVGEKQLLRLVMSASLQTLFPNKASGYSLCKGGMYQHALGTAVVAAELASFTGRAAPDVAYTAGLLHDIGKIPLDQYLSPLAPFFYRAVHSETFELCRLEQEQFHISHTEVGALLADRWRLPETLGDVIRHHHEPENAQVDRDLTTLIYLADLLMSRFQMGQKLDRMNTHRLTERLQQLGLTREQFPVLVDRIPKGVFQYSPGGSMNSQPTKEPNALRYRNERIFEQKNP